jgi:prophage DNA circulation protein
MPDVRPYAVLAAMRQQGRYYRAGQLLHPIRTRLSSSEVHSLLLSFAGESRLEADATVIESIARDAHAIAARTHVHAAEVARVLCALGCWEVRDAD